MVVDASAAVLGLLNSGASRRLLSVEHLSAPHLVDIEVLHTLTGQARRGVIEAAEAAEACEAWRRMGLQRVPASGLLGRVWELRHNVSAYDATYVALAEELDCPLLTADVRLTNSTGPRCTFAVVSS